MKLERLIIFIFCICLLTTAVYSSENSVTNNKIQEGINMVDREEYNKSINYFHSILDLKDLDDEDKAVSYLCLAFSYEKINNKQESQKYYSIAKNNYSNTHVYKEFPGFRNEIRPSDVSIDIIKKSIIAGDKEKTIKLVTAFISYGGDFAEKVKSIDLVRKAFPNLDITNLNLMLAQRYIENGEIKEAKNILNKMFSDNKNILKNKIYLMKLLNIYSMSNDPKTIDISRKVLSLNLDDNQKSQVYMLLSNYYYIAKGDYESAIKYLDIAIRYNKNEFVDKELRIQYNKLMAINNSSDNSNNINSKSNIYKYIITLVFILLIGYIVLRKIKNYNDLEKDNKGVKSDQED